jgi:type IV secretion system protein VirD4
VKYDWADIMSTAIKSQSTGLLIGRTTTTKTAPVGFVQSDATANDEVKDIFYDGEGHLMTIAPTGAGKGVGCVVPAILKHDGPVIVMDMKGENYAMTRRERASRGAPVFCIDPFGTARSIAAERDDLNDEDFTGFNPFDLLPYLSDDRDTACRALADMMVPKNSHGSDTFWRDASIGVIAALIDCYESQEGSLRSIGAMLKDLGVEVPYATAPGHFSGDVSALSALTSDPWLMDEMIDAGITTFDACRAYEYALEAYRYDVNPGDLTEIIKRAAQDAIRIKIDEKSTLTAEEISESIAQEMAGSDLMFELFCASLPLHEHFEGDAHTFVRRLYDIIVKADYMVDGPGPEGSYSSDARRSEVPENYPLAMHRVARHPSQLCRSAAAQAATSDKTWGSIILCVRSDLAQFSGHSLSKMLGGRGTFDLSAIERGDDMSVYIAFPAGKMLSHATVFRLIVEGLLSVMTARTTRPEKRTLLLLDEVAQLGRMDLLITAKTLLRGYGVQVWSFWQDISQIQSNYPRDWQTIMNNCRVIQVFGRGMGIMANDLSKALNVPASMISTLPKDQLLAWVDAETPTTLTRPVSYIDPDLKDLCDPGPFAVPKVNDALAKKKP